MTPSFWLGASAQAAPAHSGSSQVHAKPAQPVEAQPLPQVASSPVPPPQAPTLEQLPARPPKITWDGKQLSIHSENSTLADILTAVRSRIKTDIDVPAGAATERVAVDLGPGPAREVLTALLSGSNFDYIIQASDSDENAVQSVVLMAREKSDDRLSGPAVASATGGPIHKRLEARAEAENQPASTDASPTAETAAAEAGSEGDTSASSGDLASNRAGRASAAADEAASDTVKAGSGQQIASAAGAATLGAADAGSTSSPMPEMMQNLQNMYEQRRKLQAEQNQTGAPANVQNQR